MRARIVADDGTTGTVNQELLPVPTNVPVFKRFVEKVSFARKPVPGGWTVELKICEEWVFVVPVYVNFGKELEVWLEVVAGPNVVDSVHDFSGVCPWLLQSKLVAGEAQHDEVILEFGL